MSESVKVLIVDDEVEFAATLAKRLEIRGYDADAANCAKEALDKVETAKPDVVLLDIQLPDLNGLEILGDIKRLHPETAVILLTGHGDIKKGINGVVQGAFDFLMKPVSMATLLEKIHQASGAGPEGKAAGDDSIKS